MPLRTYLLLWPLIGLSWIPMMVLRFLGGIIGLLLGYIPGRRYRTCMINLRACFPERGEAWHQHIARRSLIHEARTVLEMPRLWRLSDKQITALVRSVDGADLLEQARAQHKGTVFITPHFGGWEFAALYLALQVPLHGFYRPLKNPLLEAYVRRGREHTGCRMLEANISGMRQMLKIFDQGAAFGILPDHTPKDGRGEMAPFFGVPAKTSALASRLARRSNVKVIAVIAVRVCGGYRIQYLPADPRIYALDQVEAVTGINATVEACVKQSVEQYWWSYPRFRKRDIEPRSLYH